ncbi:MULTISPECIES: hypothetical protein [Streptomyces]|uniref:Uncharacterized protein n=1 Tax=Streptomyces coelicolor (strain ATCC BAA-471 / A3(2) / M145) TaxID=100226 RepID=Q9X9T7_STRCO|nr:hypothetical protein [Streptomyces sp. SID7813]QFI47862.1 hypothetical protein FQ762_20255 [Streptomyces coelicolor A3(2)]THA94693.1 hypothetical protein E6R61_14610 [Streptomyces sp. LRa12]TYP12743.1 hypothetical protein FHV91_10359 [Streptomyces coelicolor]TYP16728.1 hypothetical protein FHV98_10359 [Streptomyces coelicolor A3(2)]
MTGAGDSWLHDGLDGVAGVESGLWVRGVDYVGGWRSARESADRLNRALLGAGFELSAVRAVASADETGRGVVRLAGWPETADRLAVLLEALADRDDGGQ